jgi:hypothetical protein
MIFDARQIARGWLAVALAASGDKDRPQLFRTVNVEQHAHGVRLVATDSYVLLHAYVPELHHEDDPPPGIDEAPIATCTAMDPHGRAKGFLAHVLKLATTNVDGGPPDPIDIYLRLNVLGEERTQGTLVGLEARTLVLEQPEVERLVLDVYEGSYPSWRGALGLVAPVVTDRIALNPEIVGRLAKIGKIHPSARLGWTFSGPDRPARIDAIDSDPYIDGLVMPAPWDFAANRPVPTDPDDGDE